jgi:AraC family transcriptional regulator
MKCRCNPFLSQRRSGRIPRNTTTLGFAPFKRRATKGETMEPKIVKKDGFRVVGMRYVGRNETGEISRMWDEFVPRIPEVRHPGPAKNEAYGLCCTPKDAAPGVIEYIAGIPVVSLADIPAGMVGREVPAQTYAVFAARGLSQIHPTYAHILNEWLPRSSYEAGDGPDFEHYDERFDPKLPDSAVYIYFPVRKKVERAR